MNNKPCFNVINVDESKVIRPPSCESVVFSCDIEKPCFTIKGGYLAPVQKCYTVRFPNALEFRAYDILTIGLRIPRTIKSENYEYVIDSNTELSNQDISFFIRGTENCEKKKGSDTDVLISTEIDCGWLSFGVNITLTKDLGDVCEFSYSICFDPIKLIAKTKQCECDKLSIKESVVYNCDPYVKFIGGFGPPMILVFPVPTSQELTLPFTGVECLIINWGDSEENEFFRSDFPSHTYAEGNTYVVTVFGVANALDYTVSDMEDRILTDVLQYGELQLRKLNFFDTQITELLSAEDIPQDTITDMSDMFRLINSNPDVPNWPNISNWDVSNVTNMARMFLDTENADPDVTNWNVANVVNMEQMFENAMFATAMGSPILGDRVAIWNVSSVTNMRDMFKSTRANPTVTNWNVRNVRDMSGMFQDNIDATPDTSGWDTRNARTMSNMFNGATMAMPITATSGNIWNVGNVTDMSSMFEGATMADPDSSEWNTSNVRNMSNMFKDATSASTNLTAATSGNIWNVGNVTDMSGMFEGASLATPNTSGWDVRSVQTMQNMFNGASAADPITSSWDLDNLSGLGAQNVFTGATAFNMDDNENINYFVIALYNRHYNGGTPTNQPTPTTVGIPDATLHNLSPDSTDAHDYLTMLMPTPFSGIGMLPPLPSTTMP